MFYLRKGPIQAFKSKKKSDISLKISERAQYCTYTHLPKVPFLLNETGVDNIADLDFDKVGSIF